VILTTHHGRLAYRTLVIRPQSILAAGSLRDRQTASLSATLLTPKGNNRRFITPSLSTLFALCVCVLSACATDTRIALSVPAATTPSQAPVGAQTVSITLLRAQDQRADRTSLGGIHQVFERKLRSNTDVATWVEDSLAASLTQAGYRVARAESPKDVATPIVLALSVTEAATNCTAQISSSWYCDTRITATIEIYKDSEGVQRGTYNGRYGDSFYTLTFPSETQYQQAFDGAMRDFLANAFPEVINGINTAARHSR
jgi:uncharacterized lipoprotein YajG